MIIRHDYPGQAGHRSEPLFSAARFAEVATEADRRGLQIAVHATGDGAVRNTIDGYAAAARANGCVICATVLNISN